MKCVRLHPYTNGRTTRLARRVRHLALYVGHVTLLTAGIAGCGSDGGRTIDPLATYDAYGSPFEPAGALPAQIVVAEPEMYLGRDLIMEGMAADECVDQGCLTTIDVGEVDRVHIYIVRREDDSYAFDVPQDLTGRRIVAAGLLRSGPQDPGTGPKDPGSGPVDPAGESPATAEYDSTYDLFATGLLVEKVRH